MSTMSDVIMHTVQFTYSTCHSMWLNSVYWTYIFFAMCAGAACITVYFSTTSMFAKRAHSNAVYNISITNNNFGDSSDPNLTRMIDSISESKLKMITSLPTATPVKNS